MKKFTKTLVSMLVLAAMLCNMVPGLSLVATTKAADGGYHYQLTTSITPGKEYIVASQVFNGNTVYALNPASGAATANQTSTSSTPLTVNNGVIAGDPALEALEWKIMRSGQAINDRPDIYMLQNVSTGAYLWNPAMEDDAAYSSGYKMGTAITPVQDAYNGGSFAVFDFTASGTPLTNLASQSENLLSGTNGSVRYEGAFLRQTSPSDGDGNFTVNFRRTTLAAEDWKYLVYTYYRNAADNDNDGWWKRNVNIGLFSDTSAHRGPTGGTAGFYSVIGKVSKGWNTVTSDLYTNVSNSGWRGTIYGVRIDPQDGDDDKNRFGYIDSVSLAKTAVARDVLAAYRSEVADKREGGQYPSVEYPFCQFKLTSAGNGYEFMFYGPGNGYYLNVGNANGATWWFSGASSGGIYLYEKVYDGNPDIIWTPVDKFETGGEYIIANSSDGEMRILTSNSSRVVNMKDGEISGVSNADIWSAYSAGTDVSTEETFWLYNNSTRQFLVVDNNGANMNHLTAALKGNEYSTVNNNLKNLFKYSGGTLTASYVNKSCSIADGKKVSFDNQNIKVGNTGEIFIFKKTYDTHVHNFVEVPAESKAATCTEAGYKYYKCDNCDENKTEPISALGHDYGSDKVETIPPTDLTAGIIRTYCVRWETCGSYIETPGDPAKGEGVAHSASVEEYIYKLTDRVLPGKEYIIASSNSAGDAYAIDHGTDSAPVEIKSDGTGTYIESADDGLLWNTVGKEGNVLFANKLTGQYLNAQDDIVETENNPYDGKNIFDGNKTGGYYLGFEETVTPAGWVSAAPSGNCLKIITGYTYIKSSPSGDIGTKSNYYIEWDMAFETANAKLKIFRAGIEDCAVEITPTNANAIFSSNNAGKNYNYGSSEYGGKHWNHYKLEKTNNTLTLYVNGIEIANCAGGNDTQATGFSLKTAEGASGTTVYVDNIKIVSKDGNWQNTAIDDFDGNRCSWEPIGDIVHINLDSTVSEETAEENVFTSSKNSSSKVYFYEKTPVEALSEVYVLANTIVPGASYVLVSANEAGTATVLNGAVAAVPGTVLYGGVSEIPYVNVSSDYAYAAVALENGYVLSSADGKYLTANGSTETIENSDNVITVSGGKVTVAGQTYYLYKKTVITAIDVQVSDEKVVVDFGFGFTVDGETLKGKVTDGTADVTLKNVANSVDSEPEKFYSERLTTTEGATLKGGNTASVKDGNIVVTAGGVYDDVQTIAYEYKVDNLEAYLYGTLSIIPATSIYYDDSNTSFITYTDGSGSAKWTTKGKVEEINNVLTAAYGSSDAFKDQYEFSAGAAHKVTVTQEDLGADYSGTVPTASFTFTGTGFEVFSAMGSTTCGIIVTVEGEGVNKTVLVDNYFGYINEDGKWVPNPNATDDTELKLYNIPVIRWENESEKVGTYEVTIEVTYSKYLDHANVGYCDFYLDGVRIFDPVAGNELAEAKYLEDGESVVENINLRDKLVSENDSLTNGALYADGGNIDTTGVEEYAKVGPKNEIILTKQTAVSFTLNIRGGDTSNYKIKIGAKSASGKAEQLTVETTGNGSTPINVLTSTDVYYDITEYVTWTSEGATIILKNNSNDDGSRLSLTRLIITTGNEESAANVVTLSATETASKLVYRSLALTSADDPLVLGDVNASGSVSASDSLMLKKYISGNAVELSQRGEAAADMNGDAKITAVDYALIKAALAD